MAAHATSERGREGLIDRTFVDGLGTEDEDTAIVQHVIGLAHSLGVKTVATSSHSCSTSRRPARNART